MKKNFDIAIIGNGILGLSTAFSILSYEKNLKIAIIGDDEHCGGASKAAGAMLNYIGEVTSETLKNPNTKAKLEICIAAGKRWPAWLEKINSYLPEHQKVNINPGTFIILNSKSGQLDCDNYNAIKVAAKLYNERFEEVHAQDVVGLNPLDDCRPLNALFLPDEGSIDATTFLTALKSVLESFPNINFIDNNVEKIITTDEQIKEIILDNLDSITADKFLLAAGAYSQQLIDQIPHLASTIPRLLAGTGVSSIISQNGENNIRHVIRTPNRSGACGLHILPRSKDSLYLGATNNVGFTPSTHHNLGLSQFLLQCAIDQIDQGLYSSQILAWKIGNRPVTIDTFPLIGGCRIENLFILSGTYRDGFHQSPLLGDEMARIMLSLAANISHPFKPEREPIRILPNKETAIKEVVKHYMAGFYEHNMRLARLFPESSMERLLQIKFERIYENLGTDFPFVPDIMFLFELGATTESNILYFSNYFAKRR